jgi:hypothetical protein
MNSGEVSAIVITTNPERLGVVLGGSDGRLRAPAPWTIVCRVVQRVTRGPAIRGAERRRPGGYDDFVLVPMAQFGSVGPSARKATVSNLPGSPTASPPQGAHTVASA